MARNSRKKILILLTRHQIPIGQNRLAKIREISVAVTIDLYRNTAFRLKKIMFCLYQIKHAQPPNYSTLQG